MHCYDFDGQRVLPCACRSSSGCRPIMRAPQAGLAAAKNPHITVVGSINVDNVLQMDRLPEPGETVAARSLEQLPGGKVRFHCTGTGPAVHA